MLHYMDLDVIDAVFRAFIEQNEFERRHYSLAELVTEALVSPRKFYPVFKHGENTWRATVGVRREEFGPMVYIRLPNNGYDSYRVPPVTPQDEGAWHDILAGWYELPTPFLERFPEMKRILGSRYQQAWVMYQPYERRADFEFVPKDDTLPPLRVCFEHSRSESGRTFQSFG